MYLACNLPSTCTLGTITECRKNLKFEPWILRKIYILLFRTLDAKQWEQTSHCSCVEEDLDQCECWNNTKYNKETDPHGGEKK